MIGKDMQRGTYGVGQSNQPTTLPRDLLCRFPERKCRILRDRMLRKRRSSRIILGPSIRSSGTKLSEPRKMLQFAWTAFASDNWGLT